ncbi:MAG TPA: cyclase family protein [Candidatus Eisenbacteria bacterium]|nr:cyclase family protein [Candidatus Eisenbacteria bacterium]
MMRVIMAAGLTLAVWAAPLCAIDEKKLVDLTYPFSEKTLHWPTARPFRLEKVSEGTTPEGFWYASYDYGGSEHVGTHLDAPFHFAQGKWTVEQIPLGRLIGAGIVIDVQSQAEADRDYLLRVEDLRRWEKKHGRIPKDAIALVRTGWGRFWSDRKRVFGTEAPGDVHNLHFPGVSKEAAEFLIGERRIKAIGIDTPSIDHGPSRDFIAHRVFGAANVPIFENVAFLERLPEKGATIFAVPMKIQGGSGAPLRIFALLP